ncbi:MAG: hypothetical protein NTY73_02700, partial [Candidatus Micrarchaeota archaeon]|nr:hypothetical protein [Candidatus Micrarchaeota archaeon]
MGWGTIPGGPQWQCGWGTSIDHVDFPADTFVYVNHTIPDYVNLTAINGLTPVSSHTITGEPNKTFTLSVKVQDRYGNICNSSYDGNPYVSTCALGTCTQVIAVKQNMFNSTGSQDYDALECSRQSYSAQDNPHPSCVVLFNSSHNGIRTFTLYAYPFPLGVEWDGMNNTIEEANVTSSTVTRNPNMKYSYYNTPPSTDPLWVLYNYTIQRFLANMSGFKVVMIPNAINLGDNFTISVSAMLSNDSVNTNYSNTTPVSIFRLA